MLTSEYRSPFSYINREDGNTRLHSQEHGPFPERMDLVLFGVHEALREDDGAVSPVHAVLEHVPGVHAEVVLVHGDGMEMPENETPRGIAVQLRGGHEVQMTLAYGQKQHDRVREGVVVGDHDERPFGNRVLPEGIVHLRTPDQESRKDPCQFGEVIEEVAVMLFSAAQVHLPIRLSWSGHRR